MTNTIPNVPRELLERVLYLMDNYIGTTHHEEDELRTLLSAPSPAGVDGCKCSMAISMLGDGCRYCQPQEYIDLLGEMLDEERAELSDTSAIIDGLRGEVAAQEETANQWRELALQFDRHRMTAMAHIRAAASGDKSAIEALGVFAALPPIPGHEITDERDQLRAELSAIKAQEPVAVVHAQHGFCWYRGRKPAPGTNLYAAPVSEATAQGVVPDERAAFEKWGETLFYTACFERHESDEYAGRGLQGAWLGWQARAALNAAPVQQVSVPNGFRVMKPTSAILSDGDRWEIYAPCGSGGIVNEDDVTDRVVRKLLDAIVDAQAAPAADAGLVEALCHISLCSNNSMSSKADCGKIARAALAAHSAKGVV